MSAITITGAGNTSPAAFIAWAQAVHDILEDGGWVQTADAGQIDIPNIVAAPSGSVAGYEIWRSNDAAGSLVDIYIKLEYADNGSNCVMLYLTVGWASDGLGSLTGITSTRQSTTVALTDAARINLSAGSGYICFASRSPSPWAGMLLSLERNRDVSLDFKNEVHVLMATTSTWFSQCVKPTAVYSNAAGANQAIMPLSSATPRDGRAGLGLIFGMAPGPASPSINVLGAEESSLGSEQQQLQVTLYGEEHTYIINGRFSGNPAVTGFQVSVTTTICLTRFE